MYTPKERRRAKNRMSAEQENLIKTIRLKLVQSNNLKEFAGRVSSRGNLFAGTLEEFTHYYSRPTDRFYEVSVEDSSLVVGAIFEVHHGNRSILTGIGISGTRAPMTYEMAARNKYSLTFSCVNAPCKINFADLTEGLRFWTIYEYCISWQQLTNDFPVSSFPQYQLQNVASGGDFNDILRFDKELFNLDDRREFIGTCVDRSEVVSVIRLNERVVGYGMLSKPVIGFDSGQEIYKRILGPVYAINEFSALILVNHIFHSVAPEHRRGEIVQYVPIAKNDSRLLRNLNLSVFQRRAKKRWVRYSSCNNFHIPVENIYSLGSVIFDVC